MTQPMRERLVATICDGLNVKGGDTVIPSKGNNSVTCTDLVDAILAELRKPLDVEADAGVLIRGRAQLPEHDEPIQEDAQNCFTAMIDAVREGK